VEGEYQAAVHGVAIMDRSERMRVSLGGRAPEQVLVGLVSGKIPAPLVQVRPGLWRGRAEGSALLTAKGRMVAVLRLLRAGPSAADGFLMDFPNEARSGASEHLRKFVPPRLAALRDESMGSGLLTVLGPGAVASVAAHVTELQSAELLELRDGDLLHVTREGGSLTIVRTEEVAAPAYDVFAPARLLHALRDALGAVALDRATWDTLRIEAGAPAFGVDMNEDTIPVEAGIHGRVVDYQKGCFTGQEVLIRIRDRGHVNRHLRGLRLGDVPVPASGTELFAPGEERAVGHVTSAARSPRLGEVIALGYVRREVTPPAELRLASSVGSPVRVLELSESWSPAAAGSS
jgi:folate-binding protein YgfZ